MGTNCANPIVMTDGWVYPATVTATDDTVTPLLVDAAGNVYGAWSVHRRARGAGAHLRAGDLPDTLPAARLRARQLGDARAVRRRAPRLRRAADRRLLSGQRHLYRRDLPDHRRRPPGAGRLAEPDAHPAAHGRLPARLGGERAGVAIDARRSADRQGAGARADVLLDQPQLGPPDPRRAQLRGRPDGVHAQRHLHPGPRPHALHHGERGDAEHLGARQRRRHAGDS